MPIIAASETPGEGRRRILADAETAARRDLGFQSVSRPGEAIRIRFAVSDYGTTVVQNTVSVPSERSSVGGPSVMVDAALASAREPLGEGLFASGTPTFPSGPAGIASATGMPNAAGQAQIVAQQIAAGLPKPLSDLGSGSIEIALDPPELGRVRLSLIEVAGVVTLSITAERPETADIMRRHLDLLAQEFGREGLDAPQVRIGGEGTQGKDRQSPEKNPDHASADTRGAPVDTTTRATDQRSDGTLDLRL